MNTKIKATEPHQHVVAGVVTRPDDPEVEIERVQAFEFQQGRKYLVIVSLPETTSLPGKDLVELGAAIREQAQQTFAEQFEGYSIEVMVTIGGIDVQIVEAPKS